MLVYGGLPSLPGMVDGMCDSETVHGFQWLTHIAVGGQMFFELRDPSFFVPVFSYQIVMINSASLFVCSVRQSGNYHTKKLG